MKTFRKSPIKWIAIIIVIVGNFFFLGCSGNNNDIIDISKDWQIKYDSSPEFSSPYYDSTKWKVIDLPGLISKKKQRQVVWIRKEVFIPENFKGKEIAIASGKIWDVEQTFFNGEQIGQSGNYYPKFRSTWNHFRFHVIPSKFVKYGKKNLIAVKIFSNQQTRYDGEVYIGQSTKIKRLTFWRQARVEFLPFGLAVFVFLFGLILFFQYLFHRSSNLYLIFFGLTILWFAISTHYWLPFLDIISYNLRDNLYYAFGTVFLFTCYIFFEGVLKHKTPVMRWILLISSLVMVVISLTATPDDPISGWRIPILSLFMVSAELVFAYLLIRALIDRNREARILTVGYLGFIFSIAYDALVVSNVIENPYYYNYIGYPFMILCFGIVLSLRNSILAKKLEDYSKNLEIKVEQRTAELSQAKDEIEATMEELEAINENLVSTNNSLEDAHRIMNLDMAMAVNVQKSIFPKEAPNSNDWQINYIFKPMSGVSGDLYDFYTNNNKLCGVTLMDVSGHGIASGLVTMIAKSIVQRNFINMHDKKLSKVIESINKELIYEIGDMDNYLTGVILRFDQDNVEYVNAGHTDLLYKNAKTKKVIIVQPENGKEFKGNFLGIEAMQDKYNYLRFQMQPGDSLLLYSDCLTESTNPEKEEYGIERLKNSFSEIRNGTEAVNQIENDLLKFVKSKKLQDDFTLIHIRKV